MSNKLLLLTQPLGVLGMPRQRSRLRAAFNLFILPALVLGAAWTLGLLP